ncbi:MAG: thiol peroxidase [Flavobacteriales bacterium]|nr:thiol peroxidase [Flavobacteriales bacterium]
MAKIKFKGNEITTSGTLPSIGSQAKDFQLVAADLSTKTLNDFKGSKLILNIFPSIDTGVCATSVRNFNKKAAALENTKVLCISRDLPFAQKRFCGAEGIENVEMLSDFKTGQFSKDYGLEMLEGALTGLSSRCIVVLDETGKVVYTEQVEDIVIEPDYDKALASL